MNSYLARVAGMLLAALLAFSVQAQTFVPPEGQRVTDLTASLSAVEVETLARELERIDVDIGARIQVLIIETLQDEPIEQYALRVFDAWKPGRKGVDDGVIFLLAKKERRMRIEVGRGLEGAIPDLMAKRITSGKMVPAFKQNQFAKGFTDAAHEVERLIRLEKQGTKQVQPPNDSRSSFLSGGLLMLFIVPSFVTVFVIWRKFKAARAKRLRSQEKPVTPERASRTDRSAYDLSRLRSEEGRRSKAPPIRQIPRPRAASYAQASADYPSARHSSRPSSSDSPRGVDSSNSFSPSSSDGSSSGGGASDSY